MEKLRKYFGEINMTWGKVMIMAVVTAVYTALINQVPFLAKTSFQDIAINLECWILFAVFIIVNCKKWWEACLKCFVFFLVSQPLIYLIEVPFLGWSVFGYYKYWFVITVLTLPGAFVAYQLKRKNWLSVAVLAVANGFLGYNCIEYFRAASSDFPHHLLSSIFCLALALFFIFIFFEKKSQRIVSILLVAVVAAATFFYTGISHSQELELGDGTWSYTVDDSSIADIEITDGNQAKITAKKNGNAFVDFVNEAGEKRTYNITVSGDSVYLNPLD